MRTRNSDVRRVGAPGLVAAAAGALLLAMLLAPTAAQAQSPFPGVLTVTGVAGDGSTAAVGAYRWLLEQDKTYHVQTDINGVAVPTAFDPNWQQAWDGHPGGETLAVGFHQSYMPVVGKGCVGFDDVGCNALAPTLMPNTYYYLSVVPRSGGSIGGASFKTTDTGAIPPTEVFVNLHPIPTAQISILIFHDNNSINNAPDLPREDPLTDGDGDGFPDNPMPGFSILVEDAGGRYGASAGIQSQDAFGNPLGTEYDGAGNVIGWHPLITGDDGRLVIKNLAPGKYGIQAVPPAGEGWVQTATIEGTKVIDAWVKAGEPAFFAEFGPPGFHVFIGFVKKFNNPDVLTGGTTISGTIVNNHLSRPPEYAFYDGACFGHTTPWVGLNELTGGLPGPGLYAAPTGDFDGDGVGCEFQIPNVPDGDYQLVVWDSALDLIFAFHGITVAGATGGGTATCNGGACAIGNVPVFQWFHRQEHRVFDDVNANGIWDDTEGPSALEQAFNLRWRDGTVYQTNVSDGAGAFTFDQVFPFFSWLVAEVDFVRFQATGLTVVVDNGGQIPLTAPLPWVPAPLDDWDATFGGAINPQDQLNPADPECTADPTLCEENNVYRVEHGPVLTQGFQGFISQTNAFLWGKRHYPDGENGGISGIVFYAVTRAENNVQYAAAEVWEPGIPGVIVNLYDATGTTLLNSTTTDSWDDAIPTGCKWGNGALGSPDSFGNVSSFNWTPDGSTFYATDCYDGLRVFNQARPAVFDGGYAFDQVCLDADGLAGGCDTWSVPGQMPVGEYVVEVIAPDGYEIVKPEDKNVDFGDEYEPAPELLPPPCVGTPTQVPMYLTLFPDEQIESPFVWQEGVYVGADAANYLPLCDRKLVTLSSGANAAADFFLFTEVPIAAHGLGFILDDTTAEFDPNSPQFGEKYAPPFVPVTVRDWTGRVLSKTLSDQYGRYNFLAPSTITANLPQPSGMSPNMLTTCMNDPGDDPNAPDPNWNELYSTFCYTFQYMPGVTTYLDTPVVPVAAFTGPDQFPLDCEYPDGTPRIFSVDVQTNPVGGGPYIPTAEDTTGNPADRRTRVVGDQTITITSLGTAPVPNPNYCNPAAGACPPGADLTFSNVARDFGFGATAGTVTLGDLGTLTCPGWSDTTITCTIPGGTVVGPLGAMGGRQLTVTRGDNDMATVAGVTVQVGLRPGAVATVIGPPMPTNLPPNDQTIQNAINAAGRNDLIMVRPSIYNEMVVMWKAVQLQGYGEAGTEINAVNAPTDKLATWRALVDGLIAGGDIDLLLGQEVGAGAPEPAQLLTEEGAGVLVLARDGSFSQPNRMGARIDGFTIRGASTGGGIIANGYADYLEISNNRVSNNQGFYGGGIRVGHPYLTDPDGLFYVDGANNNVNIHNNQVIFNGGLGGSGGGISMCTGSDSYAITENWICGNFTNGEGAGIGHIGLSTWFDGRGPADGPNPLIEDNFIGFNESFFQGSTVSGGGLFIGGTPPLAVGGLTDGAGNVDVIGNKIHGNSAGAGDGGGVRLAMVNGQDVAASPGDASQWYKVSFYNNLVTNNVAGLAGGGISLVDAVEVDMQNNTIANNDSLATAGDAFDLGNPNQSVPQDGAGIRARGHSSALETILGPGVSEPSVFTDNIVWQNRQFYFWIEAGCVPGDPSCIATYGLCPSVDGTVACADGILNVEPMVFDDVYPALGGTDNLLTPGGWTGPSDPSSLFVAEYFNGARQNILQPEINTGIQVPAAFDEGGNFIKPTFGPLSLYDDPSTPDGDPGALFGDYHIIPASLAHDAATGGLADDYDGDARPQGANFDIGADEIVAGALNLNSRPDHGSNDAAATVTD